MKPTDAIKRTTRVMFVIQDVKVPELYQGRQHFDGARGRGYNMVPFRQAMMFVREPKSGCNSFSGSGL